MATTSSECQQVWAGPREGRFAFGNPSNRDGPLECVGHLKVVHHVAERTLDPDDLHVNEAGRSDLGVELVGRVSLGRGESNGGVVDTGVDDRRQPCDGVVVPGTCRSDVDEGCPPADRGSGEQSTRAQNPVRFLEC